MPSRHSFLVLAARTLCAASLLCLAVSAARADCAGAERDPTPAEKDFYARGSAALLALLPPPPAGAKVTSERAEPLTIYCADHKLGEFSVQVQRRYVVPVDEAASRNAYNERKVVSDQILELNRVPPDKAAERDRLYSLSKVKEREAYAARKAGDKATADKLVAEQMELDSASDAVTKQHRASVKPRVDALEQKLRELDAARPRDQNVAVVYYINRPVIQTKAGDGVAAGFGANSPGYSAGFKVTNAGFAAGGTPGPLRDTLIDAVPRDRLQALVGKPLPSVEQSRAMAPLPAAKLPQAATAAAPAAAPDVPKTATAAPPAAAPEAAREMPSAAPGTRTAAAARDPAPAASAPQPAPAAKVDAGKALDTVNKLRGLLGR